MKPIIYQYQHWQLDLCCTMCNKSSFHIKHDHIFEVFRFWVLNRFTRDLQHLSLAHLVVDEDEHDVRLVLLLLSGLAALSVPVILVGFGPMSRQAAEAEENTQQGQNRSRTRLHLYCTRGIKKNNNTTWQYSENNFTAEMLRNVWVGTNSHERAISGPTRCRSRNHIWVGLANLAVTGIWNTSIWWSERERAMNSEEVFFFFNHLQSSELNHQTGTERWQDGSSQREQNQNQNQRLFSLFSDYSLSHTKPLIL